MAFIVGKGINSQILETLRGWRRVRCVGNGVLQDDFFGNNAGTIVVVPLNPEDWNISVSYRV